MYKVYKVYNKLFKHLEESNKRLGRKNIKWKKELKQGLIAGRSKLKDYYALINGTLRHLYAHAMLLDPLTKDLFFNSKQFNYSAYTKDY